MREIPSFCFGLLCETNCTRRNQNKNRILSQRISSRYTYLCAKIDIFGVFPNRSFVEFPRFVRRHNFSPFGGSQPLTWTS